MKCATAPLALVLVASPIWPIQVPAVPSHDDKLGFAPRRDTVAPYCRNTITFNRMPVFKFDDYLDNFHKCMCSYIRL